MIDFPETSHIHKALPKEAFYRHIPLTSKVKDKFVTDIEKIYAEWSFTNKTLNLEKGGEINEILVLLVKLKRQSVDAKIFEEIAKHNSHKLLFVCSAVDKLKLAVYYGGKVYMTEWSKTDRLKVEAKGFSLDEIWENFIAQIALTKKIAFARKLSVEERLERQNKIIALQKEIDRLDALAWKEVQPKKKFELYNSIKERKQKLEEIKNG
jgi:hypothetical protein